MRGYFENMVKSSKKKPTTRKSKIDVLIDGHFMKLSTAMEIEEILERE